MAQDQYARLYGLRVHLRDKAGPWRPCKHCGHDQGEIRAAPGSHAAALHCDECGRHAAWISRRALNALMAQTQDRSELECLADLVNDGGSAL